MSLDLTLVFDRFRHSSGGCVYDSSRLHFQNILTHELLAMVKPYVKPLPEGLMRSGETGQRLIFRDAYDSPLTWIYAGELAPLITEVADQIQNPWQQAIASFVGSIEPNYRAVLYWH